MSGTTRCSGRAAAQTIGDLASAVTAAAAADPDRQIVIDLRNNGGGDNNTYGPLLRAVEAIAHANPGRVSLITGRATFSAAGNFVTDLMVGKERAGIHLVGESPGGGLDIYGDVRVVTLPGEQDRRPDLDPLPRPGARRSPARVDTGRADRGRLGGLRRRPRPGPRGGTQALTAANPVVDAESSRPSATSDLRAESSHSCLVDVPGIRRALGLVLAALAHWSDPISRSARRRRYPAPDRQSVASQRSVVSANLTPSTSHGCLLVHDD